MRLTEATPCRFSRSSPKRRGSVTFYSDVLGLRLSDHSGDMIAFMHAVHDSDHHVIAFVKAPGPGLHHLSWDVPSINDIGLGAMQMADKGFTAGWASVTDLDYNNSKT